MAGWTAQDVERYRQENRRNTSNNGWTAADVERYRQQLSQPTQQTQPSISNQPVLGNFNSFNDFFDYIDTTKRTTNITPDLPMYATEQQQLSVGAPRQEQQTLPRQEQQTLPMSYNDMYQTPSFDNSYFDYQSAPRTTSNIGQNVGSALATGVGQADIGILQTLNDVVLQPFGKIMQSFNPIETIVEGGARLFGQDVNVPNIYELANLGSQQAIQQVETDIRPYQERLLNLPQSEQNVYNAFSVVPQVAPTIAASVLAPGSTIAKPIGYSIAAALGYGNKAREVEQQGVTGIQRVLAPLLSAGIEVATEAGPIGAISDIAAGKSILKNLIFGAIEEYYGESIADLLNPVVDQIYNNSSLEEAYGSSEAIAQTLNSAHNAGLTGFIGALLVGGAGAGVSMFNLQQNPTQENANAVIDAIEEKTDSDLSEFRMQVNLEFAKELAQQRVNQSISNNQSQQTIDTAINNANLGLPNVSALPNLSSSYNMQNNMPLLPTALNTINISDLNALSQEQGINTQQQTESVLNQPQIAKTSTSSAIARVTKLIESANVNNIDTTIAEIETITQNTPDLIKMNLQMFADLNSDLKAMKELGLINTDVIKKYKNAFNELQAKGVTKATKKSFIELINAKNSIKDIKLKHKAEIEALKLKQKERIASQQLTQTVNRVKNNFNRLNKNKLFDEAQLLFNQVFANSDLATINFDDVNSIRTLPKETIKQIDNALKQVKHIQATVNKSFDSTKKEKIDKRRSDFINNLNDIDKKNKTSNNVYNTNFWSGAESILATPKSLFIQFSGGKNAIYNDVFLALRNAQNTEYNIHKEAKTFLPNNYKDIILSKEWNTLQPIATSQGVIDITSGEKVMLALAYRDPYLRESLLERGFKRKGEINPTILLEQDYQGLTLNQDEQLMYNSVDGFFEYLYNKMDAEHYIRNGYHLNKYDFYFPKNVSFDELGIKIGEVSNGEAKIPSLNNAGITQTRTGAKNVVVLDDVADVLENHLSLSSKYIAYLNPVEDIRRIVFAKDAKNVRDALRLKYGVQKNGLSVFENRLKSLIEDLQGISNYKPNAIQDALRYMRSNAIPTILGARLSTPIVQVASYPLAYGTLGTNAMAHGITTGNTPSEINAIIEEAKQHNARVYRRVETSHDRELLSRTTNQLQVKLLNAIKSADLLTIAKLWEATKFEVAQTNSKDSTDYMLKVSELFDDVLDSQPNYTTLERSEIMRSKDELVKAITLFGSAKSAAYNELRTAIILGDKTLIKQKASGYMASVVYMTLVRMLIGALMGKDKDLKDYFIQTMVGSLPIIDNINSIFNNYDMTPLGIQIIMDSATSLKNIGENVIDAVTGNFDIDKATKDFQNAIYDASMWFGIPVENIVDDLGIILNRIPYIKDIYPKEMQRDFIEKIELPSFSKLEPNQFNDFNTLV